MIATEEELLKRAQDCIANFPAIILGSGASAKYGLSGMKSLGEHLIKTIDCDNIEAPGWAAFRSSLKEGKDLETALQTSNLEESLIRKIVIATWTLISQENTTLFKNVFNNINYLALSRLYRCLLGTTHTRLQVITTNYDCLAEYAANATRYQFYTGFTQGFIGEIDESPRILAFKNNQPVKTIDIAKVHGSLDWFGSTDGLVRSITGAISIPSNWQPLIVTPGVSKYEKTYNEPFRSVLARADHALINANSYLSIGYGFNDNHIQTKLITAIERDGKKIVILARTLTEATRRMITSGLVKNFLALEQGAEGESIAYCPDNLSGIVISAPIWELDSFLSWATQY
ncbi:MAG: hypothetical protein QG574_4965 [Cyanobacteriota bacterium erpe_2018_sw_21hr_WHONDRS-SW48-000092_B_bin.40]|jgi:hypothetical protein|nr:hypothetical protein [Cyanobacteriota bacterium erpe_2018_sw_21hr_WHONDRS-SW48-000092_B_bin.40]